MDSRFIFIPAALLFLAVVEVDNRNFLRKKLSDSELSGYHSCFYPLIIVGIIFFIILFFAPQKNKTDDELQEKYDELLSRYEELSSSVDDAYDDAICVKGYFLGWEEAPKQLAEKSMKDLFDKLYPGEW